MNSSTLIVTTEYIKTFSTVSDNLDDAIIIPSIINAQLIGLQPIIGTKLYDCICSKIENKALSGDYKELVDNYISLYLLMAVQADLCVANYSKQHNAGNVIYTDTNYSNTPLSEVKFLEQHWLDKASFYANRLTSYLKANRNKFKEYCEHDCGDMAHSDIASNYHCGISLGRVITTKRKDR